MSKKNEVYSVTRRYEFFSVALRPDFGSMSSFTGLCDHTIGHTTLGRNPLDERSAQNRDLYRTTYNTHQIKISMPPVSFEPTTPASERPQTHALNRAATGMGDCSILPLNIVQFPL
jgi:hypothetical protein